MLSHSQKNEIRKKVLHERCSAAYIDDIKTCSTPAELCKEMISKLPDLSGKILVLSDLGLLLEILIKLNEEKLPSSNVSFIAHTEKVADIARKMLQNVQLVCYNELTDWLKDTKMGMMFDVVIGNPPYQDPTKGDAKRWPIWMSFIEKMHSISKIVCMVVPQSITSPNKCFDMIKSHCLILSVDVKKYFNIGSTFCYFITDNSYIGKTSIISSSEELKIDISKFPFLPIECSSENFSQLEKLISRSSRKWNRGELHTSNKDLFIKDGKFDVYHTNAQTLKTNIENENYSKFRVMVSLSGYPIFKVINNAYCSQASFWTEFPSINEAEEFANNCNTPEVQSIMNNFKWSGWNSAAVIKLL